MTELFQKLFLAFERTFTVRNFSHLAVLDFFEKVIMFLLRHTKSLVG